MLLGELFHKEAIVAASTTPPGGLPDVTSGMPPIPPEIGAQIDQLPPGAETAAGLLQNPIIASIAAVPLSAMAGTPISPSQVMMGAKIGSAAIKSRREQKEMEADNSNSPRPGG